MAKAKRLFRKAESLDKKKRFRNITDEEVKLRMKIKQEDEAKSAPSVIRAGRKTKKLKVQEPTPSLHVNDKDWDKMSCLTAMSTASTGFSSKFTRLLQKKQKIYSKIEKVESSIKKAKDRKKEKNFLKNKQLLVGDLSEMTNSLPNLDFLMSKLDAKKASHEAKATSKKHIHRQKRMMDDMSTFLAVAKQKEYQEDMFSLVTQSIQERVDQSLASAGKSSKY